MCVFLFLCSLFCHVALFSVFLSFCFIIFLCCFFLLFFFFCFCLFFFFFFKQKTAYEMRISDWSSDVCSSDLVEILELALFPDLQRALVLALAADPHALGVITRIPKGARAACADPLAAALVALLLFLEPLFQRLHDLVPVAERLDRGHFLGRQDFLGDRLQPVGGDVDRVLAIVGDDADRKSKRLT